MANRMYKTLPSALRRGHGGGGHVVGHGGGESGDEHDDGMGTSSEASTHPPPPPRSASRQSNRNGSEHGPLFGLNLNLGLSNLISGGISFLGNLRNKKTPSAGSSASTPTVASNSSPGSSSSSAVAVDVLASHYSSARDQIEMSSFPSLPDVDGQGEGHRFEQMGSYNPTWCDLCGELIWGLYDTGATKCVFCQFTCHMKCRKKVRLNCSVLHSASSSTSSSMTAAGGPQLPFILPSGVPKVSVASSMEPNLSSMLDKFVTAAEDEEDDNDDDCLVRDESTLHNISTLRSELGGERLSAAEAAKNNPDVVPPPVVFSDDESEDDDAYKTLRDVESIQFDLDEVPVRKALDGDGEDATLTKADNLTLSRHFSLVNYVALPLTHEDLFGDDIEDIVSEYNRLHPGQQETVAENGGEKAKGFIRVQLNLRRPINVVCGQQPPATYNISNSSLSERSSSSSMVSGGRSTLTSFYLPPDTIKCLHVDTDTTTRDVIRSLLAKFRVADSPHKYALYEKRTGKGCVDGETGARDKRTLGRIKMRKLSEMERPLVLALLWVREAKAEYRSFVLQENDPGEIDWESFSVPELKNFLLILDREEAWYKKRIHEKFEAVHGYMQVLAKEKRETDGTESSSAI